MNKNKLFMGNLSMELKKKNSKECVVECGVVCIRNMVNDSRREKVRTHGNVDSEKDGEN